MLRVRLLFDPQWSVVNARTPSIQRGWFVADATLLLATDGLLKYARRDRIAAVALGPDLQMAAYALADLPRARSGALPDDLA